VLMIAIAGGWFLLDRGHAHYDDSLRALATGHLEGAAAAAVDASALDPDSSVYQLHAGVMLATHGLQVGGGVPDEALSHLRRATEKAPPSSLAFANLAIALQARGDVTGAATAALRAREESPADLLTASVAGTVLEGSGQIDAAISAYGTAV